MENTLFAGPKALGAFLRSQRENTAPADIGLPALGRRRTRGLRREEVAQLSGISTTWYTWIEQGRDIVVSPQTLSNIANVLKMKPTERSYLFHLAMQNDPQEEQVVTVEKEVLATVTQMTCPCYLLDLIWNMLAWNAPAEALFSGWLDEDPQPNMMSFMFRHPLSRQLVADWESRASRIVAELRADAMHYPHDRELNNFVQGLSHDSELFRDFWSRQQVVVREGGERVFHHPQQGEVHYRQMTWQLTSNRSIKMIMLMAGSVVQK
ncbi:XRE family transcriptional regulator [Enterobacter sp. FY-07]|uniref:helix-turn-helix transcriptional regulator n=1 Tax=Kosakonia oryzendophytica TaxID=1005665 RepID=UPI0007771111|nr:helix-turn-helix transcriptional regulator [Kosakonia oryzendophytica]AMO47304.1 XRE family transcriptional regulator [Enterobacter sp. FY-07]WBT59036.1 helix-turn-helix transcriptional regulator [Kosakonia oryzendophytica]